MEDFTSGSKVCILTVDPRAKHQCYLIHENKGKVDTSGVWWSNDSCYLPTHTYSSAWRSVSPLNMGLIDDEEFFAECMVCDTVLIDEPKDPAAKDFCPTCGSCWGCATYKTDCLCYLGSNSAKTGNWWNSDVTGGWGW
jgi:hypothetical protein